MKHQKTDPGSRVWIISRGPDGRLQEQIDPAVFEGLPPAEVADIADALFRAAGQVEIARSRLW